MKRGREEGKRKKDWSGGEEGSGLGRSNVVQGSGGRSTVVQGSGGEEHCSAGEWGVAL